MLWQTLSTLCKSIWNSFLSFLKLIILLYVSGKHTSNCCRSFFNISAFVTYVPITFIHWHCLSSILQFTRKRENFHYQDSINENMNKDRSTFDLDNVQRTIMDGFLCLLTIYTISSRREFGIPRPKLEHGPEHLFLSRS